jgi:hypothetical protein
VDQQPGDEAQHELGHQAVDVDRHRRIAQRGDAEQRRESKAVAEQPAAASAPQTMNSALRMLLAAMIRARCSGALRNWIRAYSGTMKKPSEEAERKQVEEHPPGIVQGEQSGQRQRRAAGSSVGEAKARSMPKSVRPIEPKGTRPISTCPADSRSQSSEPKADADREYRQQQGHRGLVATEDVLRIGRELRQEQCAVQPEPGNPENRQKDRAVLARKADVAPGLGERD